MPAIHAPTLKLASTASTVKRTGMTTPNAPLCTPISSERGITTTIAGGAVEAVVVVVVVVVVAAVAAVEATTITTPLALATRMPRSQPLNGNQAVPKPP